MTQTTIATPRKEEPLLFEGLTWREFKAVEQLLDRPGYRPHEHFYKLCMLNKNQFFDFQFPSSYFVFSTSVLT